MARSKANADVRFHAALRLEFLLDEYIGVGLKRALPEGWGPNPSLRRYHASVLARFSKQPDMLTIPQSVFDRQPELHRDLSRQVLFAKLFASAPDYFLAFVGYFRQPEAARSQTEIVAEIMIVEGRRLLELPNGKPRLDKHIAAELEFRKESGLAGLHASVVGKARKLIAEWYDQERQNRISRNLEEALPVLTWLDARRSLNQDPDSFLG